MPQLTTAQRLAAYRDELRAAKFDADLVDDLVRDAGQTLHARSELTTQHTPTKAPIPLVICAPTQTAARQWVRDRGLSIDNVYPADRPDVLAGLPEFAVLTLPGFHERDDAQQITDALTALQHAPRTP
ncbi:hypothetical protein [Streptomyces qinglanensis]|uniref:hypothetical protein n=1 Tax=Streptomyces qinglanensis TaxID=943816 RepID=UPI003D7624FB